MVNCSCNIYIVHVYWKRKAIYVEALKRKKVTSFFSNFNLKYADIKKKGFIGFVVYVHGTSFCRMCVYVYHLGYLSAENGFCGFQIIHSLSVLPVLVIKCLSASVDVSYKWIKSNLQLIVFS